MKIDLTYKEANLLNAILWELVDERGIVISANITWRLSDDGMDICRSVADKLGDANEKVNRKRPPHKDRDLSGAPKGSILDARWKA